MYNKSTVHYSITGSGPCITLLHGFTESSEIWQPFVKELSKYYTCVTIDLPGHGHSPSGSEILNMETIGTLVFDILSNLKISQTVLVGHSMGGYGALAFAEKYPQMLSGLCLFHSHASADTLDGKINRDRTIEIVKNNKKNFIALFIPDLFALQNIAKYNKEIDALTQTALNMDISGIVNALEGMKNRKDYTDTLKNIKCPVLFIIGKQDKRIPLEAIKNQIFLPACSFSLILENTGHMGYIEEKHLTLKQIRNFIEICYIE